MKSRYMPMLALVACASPGAATAQSNLTMYGVIDMALVHESGGKATTTHLTSGVESGSRLGFRGREELGNGMAAVFTLESGFQADTGKLGQGGRLFGRQAYVGLESKAGTLTMGLQLTPQYEAMAAADPFDTGTAGDTENLMGFTARMENSIKYSTPTWQGVNAELAYGTGEVAGDRRAGRELGGAIAYTRGPWLARFGYHQRKTVTPQGEQGTARNAVLAAVYDFGPLKAHFAFGADKGRDSTALRNTANAFGAPLPPAPSENIRALMFGVSVPQGAGIWMASAIRKIDRSPARQDALQLAIGYRYFLSSRTDVYMAAGRMLNRNGAGYTVGNATGNGSGNLAIQFGLRHRF
jgi:predicted porin